jgi:hypothetical protein
MKSSKFKDPYYLGYLVYDRYGHRDKDKFDLLDSYAIEIGGKVSIEEIEITQNSVFMWQNG